jgi:hypothetical protein
LNSAQLFGQNVIENSRSKIWPVKIQSDLNPKNIIANIEKVHPFQKRSSKEQFGKRGFSIFGKRAFRSASVDFEIDIKKYPS